MIDIMTDITFTAIGFYEAVLLFGALRLLQHGHPNRIQRVFCIMMFYDFMVSAPYLIGMMNGFSLSVLALLNTLNTALICFLPLTAYALMQQGISKRHLLICFGPMLPEVASLFFLSTDDTFAYSVIDFVTYLYLLGAYAYMLFRLRKWDRGVLDYYSEVSNKLTVWYRYTGMVLIASFVLWIPLYFFHEYTWIWPLYCMVNSMLFFIITEFAIKQEVFEATHIEEVQSEPEAETPAWVDRLNDVMETQHIFCQPDLDLNQLAKVIGANRSYLSKYINQQLHTNFYEYINEYRIKEVCRLLKTTDDPIECIAQKAGYKTRSTLHRHFINKFGMSPGDWRNKGR